LFPIHASRTSATAERLNASAPGRLLGSGKNLPPTLITRPINGIAKELGEVETSGIGKTGGHTIRSMWNETACSSNSAGGNTEVELQRWTRQSLFAK